MLRVSSRRPRQESTDTTSEVGSEPDVPIDATICKPVGSGAASSSGAGPPLAAPPAAVAVAVGLDPATYKAKSGDNIIGWWANKFPFSKIESNEGGRRRLTGYGVVCALHTNADGRCAGTDCKKSLTIGKSDISEQEARLRLKRWIVCGKLEAHRFDPQCHRQCHIRIGGTQCKDLSSDVNGWSELPADDLDVLMETM